MKITFLGGADEVGANSTLIEIGGRHILVDAGFAYRPNPVGAWPYQLPNLSQIDFHWECRRHPYHPRSRRPYRSAGTGHRAIPRTPAVAHPPPLPTRILHQDLRVMQTRLDEEGELSNH